MEVFSRCFYLILPQLRKLDRLNCKKIKSTFEKRELYYWFQFNVTDDSPCCPKFVAEQCWDSALVRSSVAAIALCFSLLFSTS